MRWLWALGVTLSSGCQLLFSLDEVTLDPDARLDKVVDGGGDGAISDGKTGACPPTYDLGAAIGPYAYRLVLTLSSHEQAKATCEQDASGRSGLADLSEDLVRGSLLDLLNANVSPANVWVGAAQEDTAADPADGWTWTRSGQPVQALLWAPSMPPEPNDGDGIENGLQQVAAIASDLRRLRDLEATTIALALCECRR